jgi:cytochrome c oxidase accessory protein FixG
MSKPIDIPVKVEIYDALTEWEVNAGQSNSIVPKKITGRYRTLKNITMMVWLIYFLGPYLRWGDRQAVLLDISKQQFHIFDVTIFPQDVWVLSLTLLFFAILLAVVTSVAGRVFCGYFCFQTVWTEVFSFIEGKCEGDTAFKRNKFNNAPWSMSKLTRKAIKHLSWLLIAVLTGITFAAWFTDAYQLWPSILSLQAPTPVWVVMATFTFFTYWFAGFMREQVCFWLCPYARLQGVMYDQDTLLPAYDAERGEPRGKHAAKQGGCIDCNVCVAVCPTGVDIRKGQQEGCITCGLCIDACDSIMDKIKQPKGLIRYASHKELYQGLKAVPLFKRYRVALYGMILLVCLAGVIYGFMNFSATEFTVTPQRQPVFTLMSNGEIQNKYTLKLLNKTNLPIHIKYEVKGTENYSIYGLEDTYDIAPGKAISAFALVRLAAIKADNHTPLKLQFIARSVDSGEIVNHYDTLFFTP